MTSPLATSRRSLLVRLAPALVLCALPLSGCGALLDIALAPTSSTETVVVEEPVCQPETEVVIVEEEHEHHHHDRERCEPRHEVVCTPRPAPAPCSQPQHNAITWNPSPARAPSNASNHNVTDNRDQRHH